MNKILYPVTLLLSCVLFIPFMGFSSLEREFPTSSLSEVPVFQKVSDLELATFSQLFAIKTVEKGLNFEVYAITGQKIPGNIYRYHKNGEITYEIGRGLKEGIYIVKMSSKKTDQYVKLIRFGY